MWRFHCVSPRDVGGTSWLKGRCSRIELIVRVAYQEFLRLTSGQARWRVGCLLGDGEVRGWAGREREKHQQMFVPTQGWI